MPALPATDHATPAAASGLTAISADQALSLERLARAAQAQGDLVSARAAYEWLVAHCSGEPRHWRGLAACASSQGDHALALRCWSIVREMQPKALDALFHQGCCHALIDEPARACLVFEAVAAAPTAPPALRQRAERLAALVDPIGF